jgi:ribonuclease R
MNNNEKKNKIEKNKTKLKPQTKKNKNTAKAPSFIDTLRKYFEANPHQGISIKQLFRKLEVRSRLQKSKLAQDLEKIAQMGEVAIDSEGYYRGSEAQEAIEGVVDFVNHKFAFIVCEGQEEDIWVGADDLKFALDGDRVKVRVLPMRSGKKIEGEVIEIISRTRDEFVGKIELSDRYAFVIADSRKMHLDIFVPHNQINGAKHGDKVIVKVVEWHDAKSSPVGTVINVLGKAGMHETEMHAILAEFGLPVDFPEEVLEESKTIKETINKAEIAKRKDMRTIPTCTIDPADAKDFDDALSIQKLENGNWEIGIHIADVTHYVKHNTALEKEAYNRATSVYLVDRVVPMLPERLSNGLCSLRPNEDKLTFSAVFEINDKAEVLNKWFGRTVIHSDRRFSYEEAQEVMETGKGDFVEQLQTLNRLAKIFTEKRFKSGAMNFETPEVKFKLDEEFKPVGIFIKERKDAHRLIEEFMLLANKYVAEFVYHQHEGKDSKSHKAMVYRIHESPNEEKLQNFATFAKKFGYDVATKGKAISQSLNQMIGGVQGTAQQDVLQYLAIRTMAKARYSTEAIGHFGLAFQHYTHFTSPIRRYPDMMVHRLLQHYLDKNKSVDREEYEAKCKHSTDMEKRAADAERASIKYKQVEYMQYQEDKAFEGIITGVTEWGIYVEIIETKCEGMVRVSDLLDDFYELDSDNYRLIGRRSKRILGFGDTIKVRVKDTNLEKRTMDLTLIS